MKNIFYFNRFINREIPAFAGLLAVFIILIPTSIWPQGQKIIVDHTCTGISQIPEAAILAAKRNLHIAYGHTSHGSQLITGMDGLVDFMNGKGYPTDLYAWNEGGTAGALDIRDGAMADDVGYYPGWVDNTHAYLGSANAAGRGTANPEINVIIWSWCGQASGLSAQEMTSNYLAPMNDLEHEYFGIKFVYMTGHLDGSGSTGTLNVRNNQIRAYCNTNNKILYDFADIESYDPDGLTHYMPLLCTDNCDYDSDGNGSLDRNWATRWQNTHTKNVTWYDCSPQHTQALNGNLKAYAAWWLWARLAGWISGSGLTITSPNGGEKWNSGTIHDITWAFTGAIANVRIEFSANNGSNWSNVTAKTPNDGRHAWAIPNTPSSQCLIRISDAANAASKDTSNGVFFIVTTHPQVVIISPANSASVYGRVTVKVNATDDTGIARVEFYVDGMLKGRDKTSQSDSIQRPLSSMTLKNLQIKKRTLQNAVDPNQEVNDFNGNSQYTFIWNTMDSSLGSHVLRVVAYDEGEAMGFDDITVQVIKLKLDLLAERREVRAFSILRQYGQLQFTVDNPGIPVAQYRIMRRQGSGIFVSLMTIAPAELPNNQFQTQDKYLEKDTQYTYIVEAYDAAGQLVGISSARTI